MSSSSVLTRSVLCCFWLAGFALVDSRAGDNPPGIAAPRIINRSAQIAKTPNAPSAAALPSEPIGSGISLANHHRRRLVRTVARSAPSPQPPAVPPAAAPPALPTPSAGDTRPQPPAADRPEDDLFPPLSAVSLSAATRAETLNGEELSQPDDLAAPFQTPYGRFLDVSGYRGTPRPTLTPFAFCHHPLYFEDPNLERCGIHHGCLTDAVSAVRFFGRVPLTPYMLGSQTPRSCVLSPGPCRYCHVFGHDAYLPPPNPQGAAWQAALTVGFVFLIP